MEVDILKTPQLCPLIFPFRVCVCPAPHSCRRYHGAISLAGSGEEWHNQNGVMLFYGCAVMLLKSTTRHVRIYAAEIDNNELVQSENVLTLDIDPDNELNWDEDTLQQVYSKFDDLVEASTGQDLTEYNLRRIGSDLEHYIRSLLLNGQISYNLGARVLNYSMGLPHFESPTNEGNYH